MTRVRRELERGGNEQRSHFERSEASEKSKATNWNAHLFFQIFLFSKKIILLSKFFFTDNMETMHSFSKIFLPVCPDFSGLGLIFSSN